MTWTAPENAASASLIVRHNGAADDFAFTDPSFVPLVVRLDDYTLVNFNARIRLSHKVELFARAENLLDERYEPVFSRSEEHTSELQSLMRIYYAVFCFKKQQKTIST